MTSQLAIDADFVEHYAPLYPVTELEQQILKEDGKTARKKGQLTRKSLLRVGQWKGVAALSHLEAHSKSDVRFITNLALDEDTPHHFRVQILQILTGVGMPLASAILSAVYPKTFLIMDARAAQTLFKAGLVSSDNPARLHYWDEYVAACKTIAKECDCSLRTVYRSLYAYAQEN